MSNVKYYTDHEAQQRLIELVAQGKGILALKDDERCPPDIKLKLQKLSNLHQETMMTIMAEKGGNHEC